MMVVLALLLSVLGGPMATATTTGLDDQTSGGPSVTAPAATTFDQTSGGPSANGN